MVTRRGKEAVVVLAADEYRRLTGQTPCLIDCLLNAPRGEPLLLERSPQAIRNIAL
jgi:PHD/YefM family antitoxin component YafN of YafNO toxin-antitoxin module